MIKMILTEENGEEYPSDDDEQNDNETDSYVRCVRCQSFLGTVVGRTNGARYGCHTNCYIIFYRVDKDTHCKDEPKFLVFYSHLLALFSLYCFNCKEDNPSVKMKCNGTMVTVYQDCKNCGPKGFPWRSQPLVLGKYPAGNILLSFAILVAGGSVSKVLLVCRHMGLAVFSVPTFLKNQAKFLFPVIIQFWETYQAKLIQSAQANNKYHMVWRWQIRLYGSLCQVWCVHHVLLHNKQGGALSTSPGKKNNHSYVSRLGFDSIFPVFFFQCYM